MKFHESILPETIRKASAILAGVKSLSPWKDARAETRRLMSLCEGYEEVFKELEDCKDPKEIIDAAREVRVMILEAQEESETLVETSDDSNPGLDIPEVQSKPEDQPEDAAGGTPEGGKKPKDQKASAPKRKGSGSRRDWNATRIRLKDPEDLSESNRAVFERGKFRGNRALLIKMLCSDGRPIPDGVGFPALVAAGVNAGTIKSFHGWGWLEVTGA